MQSIQDLTKKAKKITRLGSLQTYYSIQLLVKPKFKMQAYWAYAYFRWVDDQVDIYITESQKRKEFMNRQKIIIDQAYENEEQQDLTAEEEMVVMLIRNNSDRKSTLGVFINAFFENIKFDVYRKGKLITETELNWYSTILGEAVTNGVEYFFGGTLKVSDSPSRYLSAKAAHIIHMLRDYQEDVRVGLINIPVEYISATQVDPKNINDLKFIEWVKIRCDSAERLLKEGQSYIQSLQSLRCKIAATWYCVRFEWFIAVLKENGYRLESGQSHRNHFYNYWRILYQLVTMTFRHFFMYE